MSARRDAPVRVLQLLQGLAIGGIERMVLDLVFALDRREFATGFCAFDREGQLAPEITRRGLPLHFRKRRGTLDAGFVLWLAGLLRRERIQILHAHNATAFFYGTLAASLVPRTRCLYTEHDRAFPTPLRERGLHALLARRVDAVVTVSDTLRDNLIRYEAFPGQRVHVIKNGVELRIPQRSRAEMRDELQLGGRPTAGIVARLAPVKNHALLLHAWSQVVREVPGAVLLVVGNGSTEPATRALAAELGLGDSVRFLGFRLDIPELLQALDVFVLSSSSEGLSLTLLEAEAAALPIVATRVGGNPEVVRDGVTGLLVPSGEPAPLAAALAQLLRDPAARAAMGQAGRATYQSNFTLQAMVDGYARLYRDLAGVPAPAAGRASAPAPAADAAQLTAGGRR
jgi:glycosyltransferase involved in cell wall biosynthesis